MAAPQTIVSEQKYERLGSLYLTLWKQLDVASGAAKWLQLRQADPAELKLKAEAILAELQPHLAWQCEPTPDVVDKDFRKTQEFANGPEEKGLDVFKDYLRENALRYSELASGEA